VPVTRTDRRDGVIDMHDYGPVPTEEMQGVEAYLQTIGTSIGDWRTWEPWPTLTRTRRANRWHCAKTGAN